MTDTALGLSDKEFLDKDPAEFLDFSESEESSDTAVEEETMLQNLLILVNQTQLTQMGIPRKLQSWITKVLLRR